MACCKCCCGGVDCAEGDQGKCCCGGSSGACCQEGEYCCSGACKPGPCCTDICDELDDPANELFTLGVAAGSGSCDPAYCNLYLFGSYGAAEAFALALNPNCGPFSIDNARRACCDGGCYAPEFPYCWQDERDSDGIPIPTCP